MIHIRIYPNMYRGYFSCPVNIVNLPFSTAARLTAARKQRLTWGYAAFAKLPLIRVCVCAHTCARARRRARSRYARTRAAALPEGKGYGGTLCVSRTRCCLVTTTKWLLSATVEIRTEKSGVSRYFSGEDENTVYRKHPV